ncbi:MAG: hypothetical protein AB8H12_15750 [Lewinella sp.]
MSKGYALALIFTALCVFGSFFYLQNKVLTERHTAISAYSEAVNERVIALKQEQLDELVRKTNKLLQDETKVRFRPIQPFMALAREGENELLDIASAFEQGDIEDLNHLLRQRQDLLIILRDSAASLLMRYGHLMDLSPDDIKAKMLHQQKIIAEATLPPINGFGASSFSFGRDLILLDYLNVLEKVLMDVTQISGGMILNCFPPPDFFPVINHGFSDPKFGETITTSISIGKLDHTHIPENMFVLINGDTVSMNRHWMEPYTFKPSRRGKQVLKLELFVRNPLTGHVYLEGVNHYDFHVR